MPRVLPAILAGAALALAGATMHGVFCNPLLGPQGGGVSLGVAFGDILIILVGNRQA